MPEQLLNLSLAELGRRVRQRQVSPTQLVRETLSQIEQHDKRLNSFITVTREQALADAGTAEKEIKSGKYRGPLHGLPFAAKDVFATRGIRTTAGSKILRDWIPDYDATAVARLRQAGAILIGKTNQHEFSYGVTSENQHFGPVHNPWDPNLIAGGSSGGSGVAVATGLCAAALGSDTGGSIRIPSAISGVVGLKPTYGRVSRYGAIPLAWSLDHVGPITRTVADAAIMLNQLVGHDDKDPVSSDRPAQDYARLLSNSVRGVRLGIPQQFFNEHVDAEIAKAVGDAIKLLENTGARAVPVNVAHLELCSPMSAHITLVEAASYHEPNMRKRMADYGDDPRLRLEAGRCLLATDYVKSQRARTLLEQSLAKTFANVDVLITPTLPAFPQRIGEYYVQSGDLREHVVDAFTRFMVPFNLTGLPAMSVPCGFSARGLPIGLQIVGKAFDEAMVLRVGHVYQLHTDWHTRRPSI